MGREGLAGLDATLEIPLLRVLTRMELAGIAIDVEFFRTLRARLKRELDAIQSEIFKVAGTEFNLNSTPQLREILFERLGHHVDAHLAELGTTLGRALLAPHRGYLAALEPLLERDKVRALAHITGGGFPGNIPRVLPPGLGARLRRRSWEVPPLFRLIQAGGGISDEEMERTFNMGIGMVVVISPGDLHEVEHSLERRGETSFLIGTVVSGSGVSWE